MIGVVVNENELEVVREFFELFKTPWERAVPSRRYRVVLATDGSLKALSTLDAEALLIYGSSGLEIDREVGVATRRVTGPANIEWKEVAFPVYKGVGLFESAHQEGALKLQGKSAACRSCIGGRVLWRIGYDLFEEIRYLLTEGQPAVHALTPTLELHIAFLRHLLIESKVPFIEIPPRPHGYDFICCLTHDVDFFGVRRHLFDRTMAGFLYRASLGTVIDLIRCRRSLKEAFQNWRAFLSLPLVFLRVLPDFWRPFNDYAKVEEGLKSTFFLVPFQGRPGIAPDGSAKSWRAVPYGIGDIRQEVKSAACRGIEIGIHGIDAWHDVDAGCEELRQLTSITSQERTGIRMHWLYFDQDSPRRLEDAGFTYDSTWGYNEAVGYRAGTSQVFRPLTSKVLVELPMSIMDSALFSTGRMALAYEDAAKLFGCIVDHARQFGGTLVINWHERSLAPERLWGRAYEELLERVRSGGRAWFVTAGEAVEWFRWRRSIKFYEDPFSKTVHIQISEPRSVNQGALVRVYRPHGSETETRDEEFNGASPMEVQIQTSHNQVEYSGKM